MRPTRVLLLAVALVGCKSDQDVGRIMDPPAVGIDSPLAGSVHRQGEGPLLFAGWVSDDFDLPAALQASWITDGVELATTVDGDGGVTLALDVDGLEPGEHVLGLQAFDSDGLGAEDEVTWTLAAPLEGPTVTITAPEDGARYTLGDAITFLGEAVDNNTAGDDLAFAWASSIDGPMAGEISADGQTVLFYSALTVGTHEIGLSVTDVDGLIGTDTVQVTIDAPEVPPVDAEPGDLVFSELFVNPEVVQDMYGEWVELYNTSGSRIDLGGYSFHDLGSDEFVLDSVIVEPHDYVVLCANMDPAINGGIACDGWFLRSEYGGFGTMALGNNGDEVVLTRPDGVDIDEVIYDGSWFTPATATGLDPTKLDAANNDDESMWCDQTSITGSAKEPGTPGLENDPCPE